jgi:hypothetical protein
MFYKMKQEIIFQTYEDEACKSIKYLIKTVRTHPVGTITVLRQTGQNGRSH